MINEEREQTIWKTYPEFPFIEANQFGEIRTKDRIVTYKNGAKHFYKGGVLKQWLGRDGYLYVHFRVNGKMVNRKVHRIVLACFRKNLDNLPEVNHIDCDRLNNRLNNLEYCSSAYNSQYREKYGKALGHPTFAVDLKTGKVLRFKSQSEATRQLGIDNTTIGKVINGQFKAAGDFWFTEDEKEITQEKIREIKKDIYSNSVIAVDLNSFKVFWFKSQHEAGRQLGISPGNISNVIRGRYKKTSGYWFVNADENVIEITRVKFGNEMAKKVEELMNKIYN